MKKICIYGTGKWGKLIYGFLRELGCNILYFCRTKVNENDMFCNLDVIKTEDIAEEHKKDIIMLIAIRDIKSVAEIRRKLLENNFRENQIIDINNFILDNIDILITSERKDLFNRYNCICCNYNIERFLPGGEKGSELFAKNKVIGGGFRDNNICPLCGVSDRIRWQKYVYTHFTNILKEECTVLHFAPEDYIYTLIRKNIKCDYYTGDIEIGKARNRIDITDIPFRDNFFDYVIANHVLEHITKIDKAFSEIKRVLKSDGKLIVSFPVCMNLKTREEICYLSKEERLARFGQADHVRLFGYDYKKYIEKYGFKVQVMSPELILDTEKIDKYGFIRDDILLICIKSN